MRELPAMLKVPAEVNERILTMSDPITVFAMSQSCSFFRNLINRPVDQHLWRTLFLDKFDDPRPTFEICGGQPNEYPWAAELKRRMHAEILLLHRRKPLKSLSHDKQELVLRTLTDVICNCPVPQNTRMGYSADLAWVIQLVVAGEVFKASRAPGNANIAELLAQVHVYYGLTWMEKQMPQAKAMRTASRCFVYDLRKYKAENEWGPFIRNQPGKVSWIHIDHIINVITMNLSDIVELAQRMVPPSGLTAIKPYSAPGVDKTMKDWAGVEGYWCRYVSFMDYRDLFAFNFSTSTETEPLNSAILEEEGFQEAIRLVALKLRVVGYSPCATHPHRPTIRFFGTTSRSPPSNEARVEGTVSMTADGQIRWTFISMYDGETQWLSEGIQVGAVASAMGVLGVWTGEAHLERDPVGPFWLWKVDHLNF